MPKETIKRGLSAFHVHVGWSDQTVQIATVNGSTSGPEEDGWFVDLNRNEINKLIKTLRRARDAAFGRDE